jgi:hypothetical protein
MVHSGECRVARMVMEAVHASDARELLEEEPAAFLK